MIIYTNASKITDNIAKFLSDVLDKNDIIHVSLDGANKNDNDKQRGKDTYEQIIRGLDILSRYHLPIRLTIVPTIYNIEHITDIINIAEHYNVKELSAVPLMSAGRARNRTLSPNTQLLFKKELEMIDKLEGNKNIWYRGGIFGPVCMYSQIPGLCNSEYFIKRQGNDKRICDAGTRQLFIDSNGDVYPCHLFAVDTEYLIGNIFSSSLAEIWSSDSLNKFKNGIEMQDTKCNSCKLWPLCNGGCMGLSWLETKRLNTADPRCALNNKKDKITKEQSTKNDAKI